MKTTGNLSGALHVDVNISNTEHKPFRCPIPAPQQYSHRACGLSWQLFYLPNYKFSQQPPSPLHTADKLWVIKEQSTNLTPMSSRILPMVELIKKREENQRMLRGHCGLLRHGRIIWGKHTPRSHSSKDAGGNPKLSFASWSLCCLGQPSSLLQLSTKIHGIFAIYHEGITSHQGIEPCQGRRSHLTRIIQELLLESNLTAITN